MFTCLSNDFTAPLLLSKYPCQIAGGWLVCGTSVLVLVTTEDTISLLVTVGAVDALLTKLFEEDV